MLVCLFFNRLIPVSESAVDQLCLACGLCCNGVLFKDVELQPGDNAVRLRQLGLPVSQSSSPRRVLRFPQPCAALGADCHCHIYQDRPTRCRQFECALLKAVQTGTVQPAAALKIIRTTQQRADKVRKLLASLSDSDEQLALSLRFRRTRKRMEAGPLDDESADCFAELTLAVHDLNLLLRQHFYPDPND